MSLAPIMLFVFNRPNHARRVLKSLQANTIANKSKLYIYADGYASNDTAETIANIKKVRQVIREEQWCGEVEIIESETNRGLASSMIDGVTEVINRHGKVIVVEDDLIVHHNFLSYMNEALDRYANDPKVFSITGYEYPAKFPASVAPTFFIEIGSSWTWATWKRAWDLFDPSATAWEELKTNEGLRRKFNFDNSNDFYTMMHRQMEVKDIDSWAIRWYWTSFKLGGLHLYPKESLVENIGFDGTGMHKVTNNVNFSTMVKGDYKPVFPAQVKRDDQATKYLIRFWRLYYHHDILTRVKRRLLRMMGG